MNNNMINADVIILAAGSGKRMMADKNKILLDLGGRPIIAHTIAKFYNHPRVRKIILAIREEDRVQIDLIIDAYGFEDIVRVIGGAERQDSIYNCMGVLSDDTHIWVYHRAVLGRLDRPLNIVWTQSLLQRRLAEVIHMG